MNEIFKIIGVAMTSVVLFLFIGKQNKDIAVLISLAACCAVIVFALNYLDGVIAFIWDLGNIGQLNHTFLQLLLKAVGIGLVGEIASLICADAGNSALGKTIQISTVGAILWISLPLLSAILELMNQILGEV